MDYHRMDIENASDFYRLPWYYIYFGIEYSPIKWFNKISLYSTNPSFFNDNLVQRFKSSYKPQVINKFGFVEKNFDSEFANVNYDSIQIWSSAKNRLKDRHKEVSEANFKSNERRIEAMIEYCKKNNIQMYFLSSPLYTTYLQNENPNKRHKVAVFVNSLKAKYGINYFSYETNPKFSLKDFKDDDHLTADGAKKYSFLINESIKK